MSNTVIPDTNATLDISDPNDVTVVELNDDLVNVSSRRRAPDTSSILLTSILDQLNEIRAQNQDLRDQVAEMQNQHRQVVAVPVEPTNTASSNATSSNATSPVATPAANPTQNKMRAAPSKPKNFDGVGELSALEFLNQLYLYFANVDVTDKEKATLAASYMSGKAGSWATTRLKKLVAAGKTDSWATFEIEFRDLYCAIGSDQLARSQMAQLKQGKSSVAEYYQSFAQLLIQIGDMDDASAVDHFVGGLRDNLQLKLATEELKTVHQAYTIAGKIDTALRRTATRIAAKSSSSFNAMEVDDNDEPALTEPETNTQNLNLEKLLAKQHQQLMAMIRPNNNKNNNNNNNKHDNRNDEKSKLTCTHCGMKRHTKEQCFKLHPELIPEWFKKLEAAKTISKK